MAGRWSDEWRAEGYGNRPDRAQDRWDGAEDRSFERPDRVFGERDTGAGYNQPRGEQQGRGYRTDYRSRDERPDWQDRDYQGVSPGFRQHERDYESGYRSNPRFANQDYTRGGRFYGDDGRSRIYDEGPRFGSREADERWRREMRRPAAGGTGGYDYERGYGDGGRGEGFEDRAREAGEFFRRQGRRVASWFNDFGREDEHDYAADYERDRDARGLGPKGYKRSDERIDDEVHQRLTDDPWLDASDIGVAVSNGEVTLSGMVESREAKHRAERIVEHLSGVNHVQNNLRIQRGNAYRGYDEETRVRSEGEASMETSANATDTTTRKS